MKNCTACGEEYAVEKLQGYKRVNDVLIRAHASDVSFVLCKFCRYGLLVMSAVDFLEREKKELQQ